MGINEAMVEGFYSRYISRDLANLLGGGLFIVIFWFSFRNQLHDISWYDFFPPILWEQQSLKLISFLAVAYFVGFFFDRIGDKLAPKIVGFYYKSICFIKCETPPTYPNPFEKVNQTYEKIKLDYESIHVLQKDLIIKGKLDTRILDQLERYVSLWILGKSVGLSAFFGSIIMFISVIINHSFLFKNSNLLLIYFIIIISLFLFGLFILKQGSESWQRYYHELYYFLENMKDSLNKEEKEKLEKSKIKIII